MFGPPQQRMHAVAWDRPLVFRNVRAFDWRKEFEDQRLDRQLGP